jgi:diguanylate cyclase (GGDEF)-like protein
LHVLKQIVIFLEYIVAASFTAGVLSGIFDASWRSIPWFGSIGLSLVVIAATLSFIGYLRRPASPLPYVWSLALSSAAFLSMHVAPDSGGAVAPVALVIMLVTGCSGKNYAWVIPFFLFTLGETVTTLSMLLINRLPVTAEVVISDSLLDPFRYLYLLLCGLLPSMLSTLHRSERLVPKSAVLPHQIEAGAMASSSPNGDIQKTKSFTIERRTGGSADGEQQDIDDLLSSVVFFMSRNFRSYSSLGFIYDPGKQVFLLNSYQSKSLHITKNIAIPLGSGVVGRIGTEKRSFMTGDLRVYNSDLMYYNGDDHINSILAVPIISENGELLGTLVLDSLDKQAFRDQDKDTLKRFSSLAAALITTARMRATQERSARMFQTFYEASHQLTTALKVEDVFGVLFGVVPTVVPVERQLGIIFDEERGLGTVLCAAGIKNDLAPGFSFPINTGLYAFAFQKRRAVVIGDYRACSNRFYRFQPGEPNGNEIRSLAIFPIIDDEQRCRGLFSVENSEPDSLAGDTEQVLTTLVENASIAFIRAVLYQRMEKLATTDGLTGLNNHRHFQEILSHEIERARRYRRPLALLLMDIDHFKSFNDTYGHPVGDLVLKEIALCIRQSIRVNDIPARYGGEEFVVIIPETPGQGALITAERIRSTIEAHTVVSLDRRLKVTVSIGCSVFPESASTQKDLIDTADKALYSAKHNGRNRVVPYQQGM